MLHITPKATKKRTEKKLTFINFKAYINFYLASSNIEVFEQCP